MKIYDGEIYLSPRDWKEISGVEQTDMSPYQRYSFVEKMAIHMGNLAVSCAQIGNVEEAAMALVSYMLWCERGMELGVEIETLLEEADMDYDQWISWDTEKDTLLSVRDNVRNILLEMVERNEF